MIFSNYIQYTMNNSLNSRDIPTKSLWNKNYILILFSNFLLYTGVYMLFPVLHKWCIRTLGLNELMASSIVIAFGLSMFLPGLINNYLVDAFSRKAVCMRSMLCFALLGLLYPYAGEVWMIVVLRIIQGALWGIVLMSTGSTLVIDVTPRNNRDRANTCFAISGIIGMFAGLFSGVVFGDSFTLEYVTYMSAVLSVCAIFLVSMVHVSFRAPMQLPLFSLDRFILFRTLLPGLNMMIVPLILGMIIGCSYHSFFYLCVGGGFILFLLTGRHICQKIDGRIAVVLGLSVMLAGMSLLTFSSTKMGESVAGAMIGFATGASMSRFWYIMARMPLHCERGTGYNTYQLLWELGIMSGIFLGDNYYKSMVQNPYLPVAAAVVLGMVFYVFVVHPHFLRTMKKREE